MSWATLRTVPRVMGWLVFAAGFVASSGAQALERQWHVGASVGGTNFTSTYELGPSAGLYAAYGVSDMFDARLQWTLSRHEWNDDAQMVRLSSVAGMLYKLDVIEWVPYFGALIGYSALFAETASGERGWFELALPLGLDYAFSPAAALGLEASSSLLLGGQGVIGSGSLMLRAEYRWGF